MEGEVDPVFPALQVFQVRKVQGSNLGKIYAMKVLRKVSHLLSHGSSLSSGHSRLTTPGFGKTAASMAESTVPVLGICWFIVNSNYSHVPLNEGIDSEKCVVRQFCRANITERTYTDLGGLAYCTPGLCGSSYCSWATSV